MYFYFNLHTISNETIDTNFCEKFHSKYSDKYRFQSRSDFPAMATVCVQFDESATQLQYFNIAVLQGLYQRISR